MKPDEFKQMLEEQHSFPGRYLFKFISPLDKKQKVVDLFPNQKVDFKSSSKGNYISITVNPEVESSEDVMKIYSEVHEIGGVIAL